MEVPQFFVHYLQNPESSWTLDSYPQLPIWYFHLEGNTLSLACLKLNSWIPPTNKITLPLLPFQFLTSQPFQLLTLKLWRYSFFNFYLFFIFLVNFYWRIVALQCCVGFLLYSKVNQSYVYIYPLFFWFPSHLGHHRALSRIPCAIQ